LSTVSQGEFEFPLQRGGVRAGAGPKRQSPRPRVPHRARPALKKRFPVHVTLRLLPGLPSLRRQSSHDTLLDALVASSDRFGLRVIHYSAQSNHLHLICEAENEAALAAGMLGLTVRIARALNHEWLRKGPVFADRYHARVLETPIEVKLALLYVLLNAVHHGIELPSGIDRFSSARWFDGFAPLGLPRSRSPFPPARTWLLTTGWKLHGLIDPFARPA
jgi:hypothetical protein